MPTANADGQSTASIDGIVQGEHMPSGFISAGTASSTTPLGVTAKALEEMDERQLAAQVCSKLVA